LSDHDSFLIPTNGNQLLLLYKKSLLSISSSIIYEVNPHTVPQIRTVAAQPSTMSKIPITDHRVVFGRY